MVEVNIIKFFPAVIFWCVIISEKYFRRHSSISIQMDTAAIKLWTVE